MLVEIVAGILIGQFVTEVWNGSQEAEVKRLKAKSETDEKTIQSLKPLLIDSDKQ